MTIESMNGATTNQASHSERPSIYIAGPMRGHDDHNWPTFDAAADTFSDMGFDVFSPRAAWPACRRAWDDEALARTLEALRDGVATGGRSIRDCMGRDLADLVKCDFMFLLAGWEDSPAARAEHAVALALDIIVIFDRTSQGCRV